ncbi:MAG: hypothetical protein Q7S75_00055 [bacterium]|nr:hypothetical protein [bacterium]
MSHSSRLSIPLILIIFVALLVPLTARAYTDEECSSFWQHPVAYLSNECVSRRQQEAVPLRPAPVTAPAPAPSATAVLPVDEAFQQYRAGERASYNSNPLPPAEAIQQYRAGERASYNNNPLPPAKAIQQYRAGERALYNTAPGATAPVSTEPDPSVWVKDSTGAYFLKSDLKSSAPAGTTLTPLQKYQAQFNVDAEFERIGKSCADEPSQQECMINTIASYRGGVPLSSDVVKVQTYINSQPEPSQPSAGNDVDCAAQYPNEGDYGRYLQCVTQGESQTPSATAPAYTSPYGESSSDADFYTYMDSCDKKYGTNTTDANICKEPILREMGISGSAQAQTPVDYYGTYAPVETRSRDSALNTPQDYSYESAVAKGAEDDVGKFQTGPLKCWSWVASFWSGCENYKSTPTPVADKYGGVTYEQFPAQVEDRQAPTPRPYTREEEDTLSRITGTAEETSFTSDETAPGPATGWLLSTQNFFSNLLGGDDASEPKATYEVYDPEHSYPDNRYYGAPIDDVNETEIVNTDIWQNGAVPYGYDRAEIPPVNGTELPPEYVVPVDYEWTGADEDDSRPGQVSAPEDNSYMVNQASDEQNLGEDGAYLQEDTGSSGTEGQSFWGELWGDVQDMWSIDDSVDSGASIKSPRQFSMAVPFSDTLFNQSLAASAFGAFLSGPKK